MLNKDFSILVTCFILQGVIRASVAQDNSEMPRKPTAPLEIRLPVPKDSRSLAVSSFPAEESKEKNSSLSAASSNSDKDSVDDAQDDEDDWDAFQSFPASTDATGNDAKVGSVAEESGLVETSVSEMKSGINDLQELSTSLYINRDDTDVMEHQEAGEKELLSGSLVDKSKMEGHHDVCAPPSDQPDQEEELVPNQDTEGEAESSQGKGSPGDDNVQVSSGDPRPDEGRGSIEVSIAKSHDENDIPATSNNLSPEMSFESESQ